MTAEPPVRAVAEAAAGRSGVDPKECTQNAKALDTMGRRAFWELRHARLRLAIAENDIAWAQELLVHGDVVPGVALSILEEILEDVAGVRP